MKELNEIQIALKAPKDQANEGGGYAFRSLENILSALKPFLQAANCTLVLDDEMVMLGNRFYVKCAATITNMDEKQVTAHGWAREKENDPQLDPAQLTGSCSSYAGKYAVSKLFAIDNEPDADKLNNGQPQTNIPQGLPTQPTPAVYQPVQAPPVQQPAAQAPPQQPINVPSTGDHQMRKDNFWKMLVDLHKENAANVLENMTGFFSKKDQKQVPGKRDMTRISAKQLAFMFPAVEQEWLDWRKLGGNNAAQPAGGPPPYSDADAPPLPF